MLSHHVYYSESFVQCMVNKVMSWVVAEFVCKHHRGLATYLQFYYPHNFNAVRVHQTMCVMMSSYEFEDIHSNMKLSKGHSSFSGLVKLLADTHLCPLQISSAQTDWPRLRVLGDIPVALWVAPFCPSENKNIVQYKITISLAKWYFSTLLIW